jgi:hypothetical protein
MIKKDGSKSFTMTCRVQELEFVGKKDDDIYRSNHFIDNRATMSKNVSSDSSKTSFEDDTIPF